MDADWYAFCEATYKGMEGKEWEEQYYHYIELNQATGAKKPSESQKAKALWAMKATRNRDEEFFTIWLALIIFHCGKNTSKTRWRHWKRC